MGTCCSIQKSAITQKYIFQKLIDAIQRNQIQKIKRLIRTPASQTGQPVNIDTSAIPVHFINMSPLGYSLYIGACQSFIILVQEGKASIKSLYSQFHSLGKSPVDILCQMGHLGILQYFLPMHLQRAELFSDHSLDSQSEQLSIFTRERRTKSQTNDKSRATVPATQLTPIQRACQKNRLEIVEYLYNYFENPPSEFNIHYIEESTGENCAIISCKTGNLQLVKFLHRVCHADFHVINKRKESSLQVMAAWSKKRSGRRFIECVKYLVEVVQINLMYEYEETLLVLEDKQIISYIEYKLGEEGIRVSKNSIDEKYSLNRNRIPNVVDPKLQQKLNNIKGTHFEFREVFKEELEDSQLSISSISPQQSKPNSHLNISLSNFNTQQAIKARLMFEIL